MESQPTKWHNPYLVETFQAFMAEAKDAQLAAIMALAHVQHGQLDALNRISDSLDAMCELYTDPIERSTFDAMLIAMAAKRSEARKDRQDSIDKEEFDRIFDAVSEGGKP